MKRYFPLLLLVIVVIFGVDRLVPTGHVAPAGVVSAQENTSEIGQAFRNLASNVQVRGRGTVLKVLADDTRGSRHQRFILRLPSGQTILVAHNIDLAPRVPGLSKGDVVGFNGIYEWNSQGGVVHWTHRDPDGRHAAGWLVQGGHRYQ
ncbi:MAG: DUF3465 domain-containing protein [Salinisphaera sp.]|jgi:hypothetical protein|nr:DUF3465 domain-containing protein [Salinisphaera sp.]